MTPPGWLSRRVSALYQRSRESKLARFLAAFRPAPGTRILDIGVNPHSTHAYENLLEQRLSGRYPIVALSLEDPRPLAARLPEVRFVQGDGLALPFADGAFDLVFSNAVIEHVGAEAAQRRFVAEVVRVGAAGFLTTPNYWFPIEQHVRLPGVHFLPPGARRAAVAAVRGKRAAEYLDEVHLLSARRFRALFPESVEVEIETLRTTFWPEQLLALFRRR